MTARRWWYAFAAVIAVEAGCMAGVWWLSTQDVSA